MKPDRWSPWRRRLGRSVLWGIVPASLLMAVVLYGANLAFGNLNQDEGWYLYAAWMSREGLAPYRDFFFTQGPVMPTVYGWFAGAWLPHGVAGGRLLTAVFGLTGGVFAALAAARIAPRRVSLPCAVTAFLLICGNVYHSYFTTIPKTYALAALLVNAGVLLLTYVGARGARGLATTAAAGMLLAAAGGTRLSLGLIPAVIGVYLLCRHRRWPWRWLAFGIGGGVMLAVIFGPVLLHSLGEFRFAQSFHGARGGEISLKDAMLYKAGFVSRCVRAYPLPILLAVGIGIWRLLSGDGTGSRGVGTRSEGEPPGFPGTPILLAFLAVTGVHLFVSPYPYDDYQVPVFGLLGVWCAAALWRRVDRLSTLGAKGGERNGVVPAVLTVIFLASAGLAFSSQINQDWFLLGQDRFWVRQKSMSDLKRLQETGKLLREQIPEGEMLLTQDVYLAVEAGRRVPPGFELGPFGYFPGLSTSNAVAFCVLNEERAVAAFADASAPMAAFSGYGLAIGAPSMKELPLQEQQRLRKALLQTYEECERIPDFGQAHTELIVYRRRDAGGE